MTPVGAGAGAAGSRLKHAFATPGAGSAKTVLLQSTPPVNCLGLVKLPFAPYTTSSVSLNEQRPPSLAQNVHDEPGPATVVAVTTAVAADVAAVDPLRLLAVTDTRIVEPTSAATRR